MADVGASGNARGRPAADEGAGLPAVIICGLGTVGARVAELLAPDHAVTILSRGHDERFGAVAALPNVRLLDLDFLAPDALRQAGLPGASAVLAVSADDFANFSAALLARELDPAVPLVVRMVDPQQAAALGRHIPGALGLSVPALAAPIFGVAAYRAGHHAARIELLGGDVFLVGDHPWLAAQLRLGRAEAWPGSPAPPARVAELERERGLHILSRRRGDDGQVRVDLLPSSEQPLAAGDELLVVGPWERMVGAAPAGAAGGARRAWDEASARVRTLLGGVRPVVWGVAGVTVAVIAFNTALFALTYHLTPLDALYFVVSTITTVGYGDITLHDAPPALKVYGVLLMLFGVLLMASLYAVLTDYLVGSRLNELLGARPLPRRSHVIVCGLGTVGLRSARMLRSIGEAVIAVDAAGAPLERARAHDIPVVPGDAGTAETLRRANVEGARCVVAATSDDRANLAIALAAREASSEVAIVLRLFDRTLIGPVRSALGIDETLSASEPAAHAFALAARLGLPYRAVLEGGDGTALHILELVLPETAPGGEALDRWLAGQAGERVRVLTDSAVSVAGASHATGRAVALAATPAAARRLATPAPAERPAPAGVAAPVARSQ